MSLIRDIIFFNKQEQYGNNITGDILMGRVEKFRQERNIKKKYVLSMSLFLLLLLSGICVTDYSVNSLLRNEKKIEIISFDSNDYYCEISLMNQKIYINTKYLSSDYQKFKKTISNITRLN